MSLGPDELPPGLLDRFVSRLAHNGERRDVGRADYDSRLADHRFLLKLRRSLRAAAPETPGDFGLDRLQASLDAFERARKPGLGRRLRQLLPPVLRALF